MADRQGQEYRHPFPTQPSIGAPDRQHDVYDEAAATASLDAAAASAEDLSSTTAYDTSEYDRRIDDMRKYQAWARELLARTKTLLELAIKDLDRNVNTAPRYILNYLEKLTGTRFPAIPANASSEDIARILADPRFTLDEDTVQCIFRVAGYTDPNSKISDISDAAKSLDTITSVSAKMRDTMTSMAVDEIIYGAKLLWITIKMCMVVAAHYTFGHMCAYFKGKLTIGFTIRVPVIKKKIGWKYCVGDDIAAIFGKLECKMIELFGYRCLRKGEAPKPCDGANLESNDINAIQCCTDEPLFMVNNGTSSRYVLDKCMEQMMRDELINTSGAPGFICSTKNRNDTTKIPSATDIAMAKEVAEYLLNNSQGNIMSPNDIANLQTAQRYATNADDYAQVSESALQTGKNYIYTGERTNAWDCFGYQTQPGDKVLGGFTSSIDGAAGTNGDAGALPLVEQGSYLFDVIDYLDGVINDSLKFADRIVMGTANLAKWGSSRQLCCWVYLTVLVATMWESMIIKGQYCPDFKCDSEKEEKDGSCADAIRKELMYAAKLRGSKNMARFIQLLKVLKQIIDTFIRQQKRAIFIQGLKLPLHDMWENMRTIILGNLSQFLDIIFGPFDLVLAGIRGTPEIRNMINNDCFGFGSFLDFLSCQLGLIKASILEQIEKFLSFQLNDLYLFGDILISRQRLKVLESFSKLLQNIINLLLGLKDCYDPNDVVKQILDNQAEDQYSNYINYQQFVGSKGTLVDEATESVTGIGTTDPAVRIHDVYGVDKNGPISRQYNTPSPLGGASFGEQLDEIAYNIMKRDVPGTHEDGTLLSITEFREAWLSTQNITENEYRESLEHLYTILSGAYNATS